MLHRTSFMLMSFSNDLYYKAIVDDDVSCLATHQHRQWTSNTTQQKTTHQHRQWAGNTTQQKITHQHRQ
jgi:hypothetical protein